MKEISDNARILMKPFCRVCPQCDGRACAGEVPGMGGLGTGSTFRANVDSLREIRFNMRCIHDASQPDTAITFLGKKLALPLLAAPIGGVSFNMGGKVSEADYIRAVLEGCQAKGILGCTGDGVPDFIHQAGFDAIRGVGGSGIPFIKPWEDRELFEKMEKAEKSGAFCVGMDIDAAGLITLRKMGRPVSPKGLDKLRDIVRSTSLKFILKGIMTPDEAELAVEAGVDAIVVSNHGGRVLDNAPGTAEVLAGIADRVKGRVTILADGGIRSGGDVLKFLALGADAVMIGRPFSVAAMGGLKAGVEAYIDTIEAGLRQTMVLTGTHRAADVKRSILFSRP
ncbi:MAG: alpha-hydroxy-acid oxidizing protein [Pseudomonadota bacterium]